MATKKTGGLGRDFNFILEDNMPIDVQSPRKTKRQSRRTNPLANQLSKTATDSNSLDVASRSSDCLISSDNLIKNSCEKNKDSKVKDGIETPNQKAKSSETFENKQSNINSKASMPRSDSSRKKAVEQLLLKINTTLKDEKIDTITTDTGKSSASGDKKPFQSRLVKIRTEKTQKEGNSYVKAKKRTWS